MANARSRDPRLLKMRNQIGDTNTMQGHSIKIEQESSSAPVVPQMSNSLRGLPRIPKHNKSSHDREDPRKQRRDKDNSEEKSSSSSHRSKSSSSKSSPSKKSSHESSRKRDDERKSSSKSSSKTSRSHSTTSSKSPSKSSEEPPKDIDLRVLTGDVDMRPDSTTAADKNKLLDQLLHNEDIRSSQDSMISTSNDNGKEQIAIKIILMRLTMYHNKFCYTQNAIIYYDYI